MDELISNLLRNGVFLSLEQGRLKVKYNGDAISNDLLEQIKANKSELIAYFDRENGVSKYEDIKPVDGLGPFGLSSAQRRLWVLSQMEQDEIAYKIHGKTCLNQKVEVSNFKQALYATIDRHEILRTVFKEEQGNAESNIVKQWVLERAELGFELDYQDLRCEAESDSQLQEDSHIADGVGVLLRISKEEKVDTYIDRDLLTPFDLEKGPLLRAALFQLEEDQFIFYLNMHHIISDGWSIDIFSKDLFKFYKAFKENNEPNLAPLKIQYKDYSAWQLSQLDSEIYKEDKSYWLNQLAGELPLLDLPTTKQRPKIKTSNGHKLSTIIDQKTVKKLSDYSQTNGGSIFMTLLALWKVLLYRYTAQKDIVIGTPTAGREHADLQDQIGFYVNTLALRNQINPADDFNTFYEQLKQNTLNSYKHQKYPFDRLIEELNIQRDTSRSPVFDVILTYQNEAEKIEGLAINSAEINNKTIGAVIDQGACTAKFDLDIEIEEIQRHLALRIMFNVDVYEKQMVSDLICHFQELLNAVLENPKAKISDLNYLSSTERESLLGLQEQVGFPEDKTVIDLFTEQVEQTPNNIALVFNQVELSYSRLDELSNQFAHYLQEDYKIKPNDLIGIKQDRSEWMIISILAVLKSGGAYVPIDPENPQERIEFIEKDTKCKVCIDEHELNSFQNKQENYSTNKLVSKVQVNDLAYIIYTSGSTGKPKGVMVDHHNVVRLFKNDKTLFNFKSTDVWTLFHSYAFDFSVWEMYGALLFGGKVVLVPKQVAQDPNAYLTLLKNQGVTILNQTPSSFYNLSKAAQETKAALAIRYVIFGGEALSPGRLSYWHEQYPNCQLINMYGITEGTVHTTYKEITQAEITLNKSNIGTAIPTVNCLVLDENRKLVPYGVSGELYIGGEGIAQGYLNREALTKERFVPNPFSVKGNLYRTGDKVKQLITGDLEYLGRIDDQVKIRGHRIELGEIENALSKNKAIEETVVLAKENDSGEKELIAYLTSKTTQNASDLRIYLRESLPDYMLPAYYVQLDRFPLTTNGKVNKKALPNPEGLSLASGVQYVAPRNQLETQLVSIWEHVLLAENIGIKDDFFALGGNSLKGIRLLNDYKKKLEVKLALRDLFTNTTIIGHTELINAAKKSNFVEIPILNDDNLLDASVQESSYAISDAQRRLWILSQFEESSLAYNMPGSIKLSGKYDLDLFQKAFDSLIERHEILRTVLKEVKHNQAEVELRQVVYAAEDFNFSIDYVDFRRSENKTTKAQQYITEDSIKAFDLEKGPLLRAALLQIEDESFVFYFNLHHIISDGWSMEVLSKDLFTYYQAYEQNKTPEITDLRIHYKDYSTWQLAQLNSEEFKEHKAYWLQHLSGDLPVLDLPSNKQRPIIKTHNGYGISTYLNTEITRKLKAYSEENGGSIFISLLASWKILMYRYTGQKDIIIGTPIAAREHPDLENQIGFYANTLALRNKLNPKERFTDFYKKSKEIILKGYEHQMYPFDRLVEELNLNIDLSRSAVFDMLLTVQNRDEKRETFDYERPALNKTFDLGKCMSKFDVEISFQEVEDYLSFQIVFNPDVYEKGMIGGLMTQYKQLLFAILENPEQEIGRIDYLTEAEKEQQLVHFKGAGMAYSAQSNWVDLFEEQVGKTPNKIAVSFEGTRLTYSEISEVSNQLANYLRQNYNPKPNDLIGIKLARTEWMIITVLGVLKSGGAYVSIDPNYPQERIDFIEKDSNCLACLDESELNEFRENQASYSIDKTEFEQDLNNLAYVIYTSGSTGTPKGVMISHKNVYSFIKWTHTEFEKSDFDSVFFTTSLNFDLSVFEIFHTLSTGKELQVLEDGLSIPTHLDKGKKQLINTVPSVVGALLDQDMSFESIAVLNMAGEPIPSNYKAKLIGEIDEIRNLYGPSEDTTYSTSIRIDQDQRNLIGKPISNTQVYILNETEQLQSLGVIGEICISGDCVAKGYLNKPELTKEKFIKNPFNKDEILYKTGDLGRWLSDGNIEFLGREDDQIKIRGYRIELGEIEYAIMQNEGVEQVVIVAHKDQNQNTDLAAYLVTNEQFKGADLQVQLQKTLPPYMVPSYFVQLQAFPLTPTGKVDKKALPSPEESDLLNDTAYLEPQNALEKELVEIWEDILQRKKIGVRDNFFNLGGQSLKAVKLSNAYQKNLAVKLTLKELFANTTVQSHAALIQASNKEEFLEIPALITNPNLSYAISDAQRRLWVLSQFEGGTEAYTISSKLFLNEQIDKACFKRAIDATIDRHEILRTVFKEDNAESQVNEIVQRVLKAEEFGFEIKHLDYRDQVNKEAQVDTYLQKDAVKPFNLAEGPLFRVALIQLDEENYVLAFNMHHIISDGWSMEVLSKDVFTYYEAFKENKQPKLKALRIQYKDYSAWQLSQLKSQAFNEHKAYWMNSLSGELPLLDLPSNKQRPRVKTREGKSLSTYLDVETTNLLKQYTQEKGGSLFMGLLATWHALLYRYTGQPDIIIGTPTAGRTHSNLEDQIGFYVNTLALRNQVDLMADFDDFFERVKENTLTAYQHEIYPFDRLVEDLNLLRDTSREPVFDVMLILQNQHEYKGDGILNPTDIERIIDQGEVAAIFDLAIVFQEEGEHLSFRIDYNSDIYEGWMIENLIKHYKQLLVALLTHPNQKIQEITYLSSAETHELSIGFNAHELNYPEDKTIVDLFEKQVIKTPHKTALVYAGTELSYQELNERSNQLANHLKDNYVINPDDLIAFQLGRHEGLIITILAILKSGAAYLPIDIDSSDERVQYIMSDSNCILMIDENKWQAFNTASSTNIKTNLPRTAESNHLIYVIYTSGSTGFPKGVLIEHEHIVAHICNVKKRYGITAESRFLQFFNIAFDAAAQEVFTSLCFGATLYLKTPSVDPEYIYDLISTHKITHVDFSTAFFNSFIAALDPSSFQHQVEFCAIGGEKLEKGVLEKQWDRISRFTKAFYNVYGPTEATLTATYYPIMEKGKLSNFEGAIPIGKSHPGRQVLILDDNQNLQPIGVIGEICIGGISIARGYLNRLDLSNEKFITNPFQEGGRLYRTGDLGKYLADGNIEFIGRKDDQVKIRGYRIELGEIEYALTKNPEIEQAVVIVNAKKMEGEKELVAYITSPHPQKANDLRSYLKAYLPDYMLPVFYVQLDELPLTNNGKIDKKALPDPLDMGLSSGADYESPQTPREKLLATIWENVLKREGIGRKDSFYNLGGDSIKSIQVVARLKQEGYSLKVEDILSTPVLEELASLMQQTIQSIDQKTITGDVELTPIQRWFFETETVRNRNHFNQSVLLKSKTPINSHVLEKCLLAITQHHDALRIVYEPLEGSWRQTNQDTKAQHFSSHFYDLSKTANAVEKLTTIANEWQSSVDINKGPLFTVLHFRLTDGDRLGLIIHHLIVDGVSWRILLEDLAKLYEGYSLNQKVDLPLKTDALQTWATAQKEYAAGLQLENERVYWEDVCDQKTTSLNQKPSGLKEVLNVNLASFKLDKTTTELLQTEVNQVYKTEINDILLTGLSLAIQEVFGQRNVLLKMEGHGREDILKGIDISRTVGWFTSVFPFVLEISDHTLSNVDVLVEVKEALRKIPNKGIGYGILKYLNETGIQNDIKPEISFNYLGDFGTNIGSEEGALFEYASESLGANFAKENVSDTILDITGLLVEGELEIAMRYSSENFEEERMNQLALVYQKSLENLVRTLSNCNSTYLTPSDMSFKGLSTKDLEAINANNLVEDVYELSPLQEGIYYHWLTQDSSSLYFEQAAYTLYADNLKIEKLENAYEKLIRRHSVLRTRFSNNYVGKPLQIVSKEVISNFTYQVENNVVDEAVLIKDFTTMDRKRGFDLESGSQMRLTVISLPENRFVFVWSYHHILMDGWCASVLINDFNELLKAETTGINPVLQPVRPYVNYINWLSKVDKEVSLAYWRSYLNGYSAVAEIPFKTDLEDSTYAEAHESIRIEGEEFESINSLCAEIEITLNTFIQVVWGYLLSRYNDTNDIVFGSVVSGRPADLAGVEDMIGLFINTVPVRVQYDEETSPVELLKTVGAQSIEGTAHHYMNLSEVQSQTEVGKSLINHIMVFENFALKDLTSKEGLSIESMEVFEQTNYDFNLIVNPASAFIDIAIRYNKNYYDSLLIGRIKSHLNSVINEFMETPNEPLNI